MGVEEHHQTSHQFGHEIIIQLVHGIRWQMIVGVAEKGCVRNHDGRISLIPEGRMVAEPH